MIAKTILAAAAAFAVAGPAAADTQLERTLGVEPGVYSPAELAELASARSDDNRQRIEFILSRQGPSDTATRDAGSLSLAEQTIIGSALENNEFNRARFVANNGLDNGVAVSTDGKAQLAASLNVDPADYSLSELVVLRRSLEDEGI